MEQFIISEFSSYIDKKSEGEKKSPIKGHLSREKR